MCTCDKNININVNIDSLVEELREEAIKEDKNPEFYLYQKLEEKDKEIERLKAREQECIDKYLAESKYRGEIEGKYVLAKYVIDELEKWLKDVDVFQMNFIENKEHITPYKATLDKLKALKEGRDYD